LLVNGYIVINEVERGEVIYIKNTLGIFNFQSLKKGFNLRCPESRKDKKLAPLIIKEEFGGNSSVFEGIILTPNFCTESHNLLLCNSLR
jgi:hypothetical protein